MSPPIRRCGLKYIVNIATTIKFIIVTSYTEVWIEIHNFLSSIVLIFCHLLYGGVDWNILNQCSYLSINQSPPIRRCGLKLCMRLQMVWRLKSPPIRRCGLKFNLVPKLISVSFCHLLYGGVDWNWLISCIYNCRYKSPPIRRCGLKYLSYQPKLHKPFVTSNTNHHYLIFITN